MTVRETLLPAAMIPGLVTVREKASGKEKNVYPVDAKELIYSGDYELVENGAIEAARMAATPLRSGQAAGIPADNIIAEVAGHAGMVLTHEDPKEAERIRKEGNANADGNAADSPEERAKTAPADMRTQDRQAEQESASQPKTEAEKTQETANKTAAAGGGAAAEAHKASATKAADKK